MSGGSEFVSAALNHLYLSNDASNCEEVFEALKRLKERAVNEKGLREALRHICALDPALPIGETPDPHYSILTAQSMAKYAIQNV